MSTDSPLHSPICDRLGIKYPILQAGMGFVAYGDLAAAVCNAGGLGCPMSGSMSADELREQIQPGADLTDRPFEVDILFC